MSEKARQHKGRKHVNSNAIEALRQRIEHLESQLQQRNIPITYPILNHEKTPMIGHTRGNTANNRKVIKRHQQLELQRVVRHLEELLVPSTQLPSNSSEYHSESSGYHSSSSIDGSLL